ncbi:hypothetical protein [Aeromonas diversa]|uniref:hypothetical protein n=1 Tax=Aeromonas diversa TaxID=502790 RepID=UPI0012687151|nr:hypothetical protein [Aeromonas diversa]
MKKVLLAAIIISSHSFANTAYVPFNSKSSGGNQSSRTCFYMTNIADVDVDATFRTFKEDGVEYLGEIVSNKYIIALNTPFKLSPKQTASFCLPPKAPSFEGSGQIDVVASDGIGRGQLMVAQGHFLIYLSGSNATTSTIVINGGMPF